MHWSRCDWKEFLAIYAELPGQRSERIVKTVKRLAGEDGEEEFFREQVSRFRRVLQDALGIGAAPYELRAFGRKPMTRTGFTLPPAAITFRRHPEP